MKTRILSVTTINLVFTAVTLLTGMTSAVAHEVRLTPTVVNQLKVDLLGRTSASDFFDQGNQRLRREIKLLEERQLNPDDEILTIDDAVYNQQRRNDLFPALEVMPQNKGLR